MQGWTWNSGAAGLSAANSIPCIIDAVLCTLNMVSAQCDAVARQLGNMDYRVTMLHGGKSQDQREESIKVEMGSAWNQHGAQIMEPI